MELVGKRLPDKDGQQRFEIRVMNQRFEIGLDADGWIVDHPDHQRMP